MRQKNMLNSGVHKYASQVGNYKMQDSADYSVFKQKSQKGNQEILAYSHSRNNMYV